MVVKKRNTNLKSLKFILKSIFLIKKKNNMKNGIKIPICLTVKINGKIR